MSAWSTLILSHFRPCRSFWINKKIAPVKGAQVPKVGRCQRRLSQKPKFVVFFFFEGLPNQLLPHSSPIREFQLSFKSCNLASWTTNWHNYVPKTPSKHIQDTFQISFPNLLYTFQSSPWQLQTDSLPQKAVFYKISVICRVRGARAHYQKIKGLSYLLGTVYKLIESFWKVSESV